MKNAHTPGPWNCHQPGFKGIVSGVVRDKQNRFVATTASPNTGEYNRDETEVDANARLIAAAPELLESLRDALTRISEAIKNEDITLDLIPDKVLTKWDKAIRKATTHV